MSFTYPQLGYLSLPLSVANGGTTKSSITTNAILAGNGTSAITEIATANNSILQTNGSGVPSYSTTLPSAVQSNITTVGTLSSLGSTVVPVANGGIGQTSIGNAGSTLCCFGADQISGVDPVIHGNVLVSQGISSMPAFGKILFDGSYPHIDSLTILPVANGGTGTGTLGTAHSILTNLDANTLSSILPSVSGNVLLSSGTGSAPAWGKVDLTTCVTGVLPPANGGASSSATTEYTTPQSATVYSVPASAKHLNLTICGAGGGGGGGTGQFYSSAGGGGAGITRVLQVPIASSDTVLVTVGTGGSGGSVVLGGSGNAGTAGGSSIVSINGKTITAFGGGGGGGPGTFTSGAGGGSAGTGGAGGNGSTSTSGSAGASTASGSWQTVVVGLIGATRVTSLSQGNSGTSAGVITRQDVLVGGSGGSGGYNTLGGNGGNAQGACFIGGIPAANASPSRISGGCGGASALANGAASNTTGVAPTTPGYGAGGAGGSNQDPGVATTFTGPGGAGGSGYVSITWF